MPKPKSAVTLSDFLQKEYIEKPEMGSPDHAIALRDMMVDVMHICFHRGINLNKTINSADETFREELEF